MTSRAAGRPRRRSRTPDDAALHVLRAGWPSGVALLDESSVVVLEALADEPPAGGLVVLVCEFADVATDAGELVATGILGRDLREDFLDLAPAGERWTVAEVDELARGLYRYPRNRHVVLLRDADRLDRRALDRFLILLEEPPSPLLVLLCVPRQELLPATIRGRAAVTVELEVLPASARIAALVEQDVAPAVAQEAVALAGVRPSLAGPFAADAELRALARACFEPGLADRSPLLAGYRRLNAMATLAGVLAAIRATPDAPVELRERSLDELTSVDRAMLREVLLVWSDHRRRALLDALVTVSGRDVGDLERCLEEIETFHRRLRVPVTPSLSMAALVAASTFPRPH